MRSGRSNRRRTRPVRPERTETPPAEAPGTLVREHIAPGRRATRTPRDGRAGGGGEQFVRPGAGDEGASQRAALDNGTGEQPDEDGAPLLARRQRHRAPDPHPPRRMDVWFRTMGERCEAAEPPVARQGEPHAPAEARAECFDVNGSDGRSDVRDVPVRGQQEFLRLSQTQLRKESAWRDSGNTQGYAGEILCTESRRAGQIIQSERLAQISPHNVDSA